MWICCHVLRVRRGVSSRRGWCERRFHGVENESAKSQERVDRREREHALD